MQRNYGLNLSDMKNPKKDITDLMQHVLGAQVLVKEATDTFEEQSKKYFVKAITGIEKHLKKSDQLVSRFGINIDSYNELIYSAVDNLISFTFAEPVDEMIFHYIYDKDEEGIATFHVGDAEVRVSTAEDLYNLIVHVSNGDGEL
jgi:hypothetical protein